MRWRVCQRSLFRIHPPGGGYHAAVVEGGDDLVADPDGLLVDGDAFGFDLAGGDPAGSGPHGEVVDASDGVKTRYPGNGLAPVGR